MKQDWRMDPVLMLLFTGMLIFTGLAIWVAKSLQFSESNGSVNVIAVGLFNLISGIVTGFLGSFLTRMNPKGQQLDIGPDTTKVTQQTVTTSVLQAETPPNSPKTAENGPKPVENGPKTVENVSKETFDRVKPA